MSEIIPIQLTYEEEIIAEWQSDRMGNFFSLLMKVIAQADNDNREKIRLAFPDHVSAYEKYHEVHGWYEMVRLKANALGYNL